MRFQCSHCSGIIEIEDTEVGQAVACGECSRVVVVPATRFSAGSVIGDFIIQKELGHGGVGVVYLAQQISLARPAALKILHERFASDATYVADFIREARAAAQLNHPGIVQAYAVGEEDGIYYFGMEYVQGTTLKQILAHSGRLVVDRALEIIATVNTALEFAWNQQKLVHRDIKPDNIILTDAGQIKLADLGLARPASDLMDQETEEIMGTPQYISPEALLQKPMDNRSDIYSLGATLYHILTGRFPYPGDSAIEFAQKHLTEKLVPPRKLVSSIPEPVSRLVEIMMAKRPEHRYASSTELGKDIELVRKGQMPQHDLASDAQKTVAIDLPQIRGGKHKMVIGAGGVRTGSLGGPAAAAAKPAKKRKKLSMKAVGWIFGGLVALALILGGVVTAHLIIEKNKTQEERDLAKYRKENPPAAYTAFLAVRQAVRENRATADILQLVARFEAQYPKNLKTDLPQKVQQLAQPYIETELSALRQAASEKDVDAWKKRHDDMVAAERLAAEQEAKRLEEQKQREEEKRRQAELEKQREQKLAQLRNERDELRGKALDLGRSGQFVDASHLFISMSTSDEAEFKTWSRMKLHQYQLADKLYTSVTSLDALDVLKNTKHRLAGQRGLWTLKIIGRLEVTFESRSYDAAADKEVTRTLSIPIREVSPALMTDLARMLWEKRGMAPSEISLMCASYIIARGSYTALPQARQLLATAADQPDAAAMLAELPVLEPLARKGEFDEKFEQLKLQANKGDTAAAKVTAQVMKEQFGDLYQAAADEITRLLQQN